jgi:2-phospho-L-lactate guanylyltransferase (CobY/MobA/RfbA family)
VESLASLALDVDTPDDLEAMAAVLGEHPERAPATAEVLVELGRIASGARE